MQYPGSICQRKTSSVVLMSKGQVSVAGAVNETSGGDMVLSLLLGMSVEVAEVVVALAGERMDIRSM